MATPLEGAIDRFGRLVDRLPGGAARRRPDAPTAADDPLAGDTTTSDLTAGDDDELSPNDS
jgi:hypothetical protein